MNRFRNLAATLRPPVSPISLITLLAALIAITGAACGGRRLPDGYGNVTDETRNPLSGAGDSDELTTEGRRLFLNNCAICHGHEGLGDGPSRSTLIAEPANLTIPPVSDYPDGRIFLRIRLGRMVDGRMTMPPVSKMTDEDIWKTILYVRTLAGVSR